MGKVLAEAASREDKFVTWLPSYGAEVRGGTANCSLVISTDTIGSPYVNIADTLIVMNEPSLRKFKNRLKDDGVLIVNSSMVSGEVALKNKKQKLLSAKLTGLALELGNIKVANMIALGYYISQKNLITPQTVISVMKDMASDKKELFEINKKALLKGTGLK